MQEGDDTNEYVRIHVMLFYDIVDKLQAMKIEINGDLLIIIYSLLNSFKICSFLKSHDQLPDTESLQVKIIEEYDSRKQNATEKDFNVLIAKYYNK